jgi:predicted nucleic acid-binding protein
VTIVSYQEQTIGRLNALNRQLKSDALIVAYQGLARTLFFYRDANVLAYDDRAARIDDDLRVRLRRMGTKDRRIAAITLAHGHTLVTRNTIDFRDVPGLGLEDWMAS